VSRKDGQEARVYPKTKAHDPKVMSFCLQEEKRT
jgi:hypothetical protein